MFRSEEFKKRKDNNPKSQKRSGMWWKLPRQSGDGRAFSPEGKALSVEAQKSDKVFSEATHYYTHLGNLYGQKFPKIMKYLGLDPAGYWKVYQKVGQNCELAKQEPEQSQT